jgi:cytoskeletal protein CcmA (bactofilin family)
MISRKTTSLLLIAGAILIAGLVAVRGAAAQSFRSGDKYEVRSGETVDGALYSANQTLSVGGEVDGDVYCVGQSVNITGKVNGDVICAAQTINVTGTVRGNVRIAAQTAEIDGIVGGTLSVFGQSVIVGSKSNVARDMNGGGMNFSLRGQVGRDVAVGGQMVDISGKIARDVNIEVQSLTLASDAQVGGNLRYESDAPSNLPAGVVKGKTDFVEVPKESRNGSEGDRQSAVFGALASLFTVMLLALIFPQKLETLTNLDKKQVGMSLLVGLSIVIMTPVLIVLSLMTILGLYVAWMLLLVWLFALCLGPIIAIYWLGKTGVNRWSNNVLVRALAGGLIVGFVYVVLSPLSGLLLMFMVILGVGILARKISSFWQKANYRVS